MLLWPTLEAGHTTDLGTVVLQGEAGAYLSRTYLTEPSWYPDGKSLVFTRRSQYWGTFGHPHMVLLNDPEWVQSYGYTPPEAQNPWASKSEWRGGVYFDFWHSQLMRINADGTQPGVLTPLYISDDAAPTPLPDGGGLLFKMWQFETSRTGHDGPVAFQGDARVAALDTRMKEGKWGYLPVKLERHSGLAVSADGAHIAYVKLGLDETPRAPAHTGNTVSDALENIPTDPFHDNVVGSCWGNVAVLDVKALQERVLTSFNPGTCISDVSFSPDGAWLVLCASATVQTLDTVFDNAPTDTDLYAVPVAGGQVQRLTNDGLSSGPSWR
jgi:hypothetical protein